MALTPLPVLDRTSVGFKNDVDLFFGTQLPTFSAEANALQADVTARQADVVARQADVVAKNTAVATSATNAAASEANALASKNAAATSATNAGTSETNALASNNAAKTSETNAASSAAAAAASAASISSGPVTSVNSKTGVVVLAKADVGLGNVDNTSDANKPVSTAQQAAIAAVLPPLANNAFKILRVNPTATGVEWSKLEDLGLLPGIPGTPYGGGFYAGRIKIGADTYLVIFAPKASGEALLQWKTDQTATTGTTSTWDGAANTAAMIAAGAAAHPAAQFCKGLTIGGYTDWVLPAKDQLELLYRNLKPDTTANITSSGANPSSDPVGSNYTAGSPAQTEIAAFKTGGAEAFSTGAVYWSSTENTSTNNNTNTWSQLFSTGSQINSNFKNNSRLVRAVRMIKI